MRPAFTEELGEQAHRLADALGDDHDLVVLRQTLTDQAQGLGDREGVEPILEVIAARRAELQGDAFRLGGQVYRDRPRRFVKRVGAYWRAWRAEIEADAFAETPDARLPSGRPGE